MDPLAPPAPPTPTPPAPLQQPSMDPPATTLPPVHVPHVDNRTAAATTTSATVVAAGATIPPSHPPYAQMITDAITALKDRNGSSKKAIAKYIDRVYSNLPGTHSALLTHHLKRLKESGQLVMVKHSYKLAGSAPQVQANGPKRGPGRPSKAKSAVNVQAQQVPLLQPQPQPPVNATAGPGPISVPESVFASLGLVDGPVAVTKRRPGRPKKTDAAGVGLQPNLSAVKKRPGRPPKDGSAAPGSAVGRPRGRPPRNAGSPGRPRGRPSKNVVAPATVGGAAGPVLVPTGYVAETATVTGPVPPAFPILKRRGRPPKAADGPKKPRKLSGKPLGRPKKGRNSKALLDLETDSKTSIESKLLFCKEDDFFKSQTTKKKTSLPDTKPDISAVPQSQVLGKVKDFLGVLSEANKRLQYDAKDNSHKYDIEALTGAESEYIEMDLMLGVADLHTPEAVAAAESAISGSQPVISLAVSSSSDDDNDDESDDDDEKTTWATGDNSSSEEKRKNHSKKRPKIIELP